MLFCRRIFLEKRKITHALSVSILLNLICFLLLCSRAEAQVTDPFEINGKWLSLEQFTQKQLQEASQPKIDLPSDMQKEADAEKKASEAKPEKAKPERPLVYPLMPSAAIGGQTLAVSSTFDDGQNLFNEKKKWLRIDEAIAEIVKEEVAQRLRLETGNESYQVRFATLPGGEVQSVLASRISKEKTEKEVKIKTVSTEKQVKETEACEALVHFKRRQLEAMESDRQTLSALKTALANLGLSSEMRLSMSPDGILSTTEAQTSAGTGDNPPKNR